MKSGLLSARMRQSFERIYIIKTSRKTKNPVPSIMLGQDVNSCGATRLDAKNRIHSARTRDTPTFAYGGSYSVSHTPKLRFVSDCPRKSIQSYLLLPQSHRLRLSVRTVLRFTHSSSTVYRILSQRF